MAKKTDYDTKKRQKDREKTLGELTKSLKPLNIMLVITSILIILSYLFYWTSVYNTDIAGSEVNISGINVIYCALTGNFTGTESLAGDMAVPFYYYAESYCQSLATLTVISFFLTILSIIVSVVVMELKKPLAHFVPLIINIILTVLHICCFTKGLAMNDSKILHLYCSDNPACSIQSYAIIPAILSVIAVAISVRSLIKYYQTKAKLAK